MKFFDWDINFTLAQPLMFLEVFFAQGILVSKDIFHNYNKPNSELELKDVCS